MKVVKNTIAALALLFAFSPLMVHGQSTDPNSAGNSLDKASSTQSTSSAPVYGNTTSSSATSKMSNSSSSSSFDAGGNGNGNGGVGQGNGNGNQDHLPINGNIVFLLVAGVAIGIKVSVDYSKKFKAQNI